MDENKTILDGMPLDAEWHQENEDATLRALTIYSKICDCFKKDKKYGSEFVKNNQYLMGQLTIAAIQAIEK